MKKILFFAVMLLVVCTKKICSQNSVSDSALIVPAIYDMINCDGGDMILVQKNNKMGVINSNGKTIVPLEYDKIEVPKGKNNCGGLICVVNNLGNTLKSGKKMYNYGLYNFDGKVLIQCDSNNYERISIQDPYYGYEGMAEISVLDKVRADSIFDMIEKPDRVDFVFKEVEYTRLTKKGVLLKNGILNTAYDSYDIKELGLIKVKKDGKSGFIDKYGEVVVPVKYDDIDLVANCLFRVENYGINGRGIIDDKGNVIIPIGKYKYLKTERECFIVENNKQKGVLSLKGTQVIPMGIYDKLYEEDCADNINHYISVYKAGKVGAASLNGKIFIPCGKYERFEVINDNLTIVTLNKRKGIINRNGMVVVSIGKYADIDYKYGILYYSQNGKFGLLDKKGKQVTLAIYDRIEPLRKYEGTCLVNKGEKIALLDSEGHTLIPFGEYVGEKFYGDVGVLKNVRGTMFFLKDGKILSDFGKYEDAVKKYGDLEILKLSADDGLFVTDKDGKKGVIKLW